jgi:5S rRNA maturation endonuclease (ribonuclease M5)
MGEYIVTVNSHINTAHGLDNLIQQAQHQRVMVISDTAEMGKHTVLTHLSKQIKQNFPTKCWMVFVKSTHVIKKPSSILLAVRQKAVEQLWVTTRTDLRNKLQHM